MFRLTKAHGLGNDYLVADAAELPCTLTPDRVRLLCDRHRGVGSDGLLTLVGSDGDRRFQLRIFNSDGSEAEKSGNGIRIFATWLRDTGRAPGAAFEVVTPGGVVPVVVETRPGEPTSVLADMGAPVFRSELTTLAIAGVNLPVVALSLGNPHCVLLRERLDDAELRQLGPLIERHPAFPERTNVQLARVVDRGRVEALIWERGAGETLASGSSSCAVAAACYALGLVDSALTVAMPGGELSIRVAEDGHVWMRGPVETVAHIELSADLLTRLRRLDTAELPSGLLGSE